MCKQECELLFLLKIGLNLKKFHIKDKKRGQTMEFLITVAVVVMAITSLSMEGKIRELTKQNKEILELLKQQKENKSDGQS